MKYIYFHVDELYRDLITAKVLKSKFPKKKYKFIYGNRRNYRLLLKFSDYFKNYRQYLRVISLEEFKRNF